MAAARTAETLVIIPTYNEAQNISPIITEVFKVANKIKPKTLDLLIVDDRSSDGTARIIKSLQRTNANLYISSGAKQGLGKAYLRGFKWGLKNKSYKTFVMMDADFSHSPQSIPSLLAAVNDGNDYVIGSRYVKGGVTDNNWPLLRNFTSHTANLFAKAFIDNYKVRDLTGGFKALRVSALRQIDLNKIHASGYVFQVNLLHEFSRRGFAIAEVPIVFKQRQADKSKMGWRDILEFVYLTYRLNPDSRIHRLIRFALVGASGAVVNLAVLAMLVDWANLDAVWAAAIAIEVSIISNFFLNHYYTFRAHYTSPSLVVKDRTITLITKLVKYNLIALGGAAISLGVFVIMYKVLGLHYILSDVIAIVSAMAWNYWLSVKVVWRVVDRVR